MEDPDVTERGEGRISPRFMPFSCPGAAFLPFISAILVSSSPHLPIFAV